MEPTSGSMLCEALRSPQIWLNMQGSRSSPVSHLTIQSSGLEHALSALQRPVVCPLSRLTTTPQQKVPLHSALIS